MSRYKKIFEINECKWVVDSPVYFNKGALLYDNVKESNLLQVQFKNIQNEVIIGIKISVVCYDITGNELNTITHEYLDIRNSINETFGDNVPIYLIDRNARQFEIIINQIVFANNTIININKMMETLPSITAFNIVKYQQLYQENLYGYDSYYKALYEPHEHIDFWYCTCGAINVHNSSCINCHKSKESVFDLYNIHRLEEIIAEEKYIQASRANDTIEDLQHAINILTHISSYKDSDKLIEQYNIKLAQLQEIKNSKAQKRKKKNFISVLSIFAVLITILGIFLYKEHNRKNYIKYNTANELMSRREEWDSYKEEWQEAYEIFDELGGFLDSKKLAEECKVLIFEKKYSIAVNFMKEKEYEDAIKFLEEIDDYKDSDELIKTCKEKIN